MCLKLFVHYIPPPPPRYKYRGEYIGITLSVGSSVQLCPLSISCTAKPFFTKLVMVVYYHEAMCCAEKFVHYLQCQVHSEELYNQNMAIFTISSKVPLCLQPNLVL